MWRQRKLLDRLLLFTSPKNNNNKKGLLRSFSATTTPTTTFDPSKCDLQAVPLKSRSLLRLSGPDTRAFLQGLITNDINHLKVRPSLFTLFLNHQGRVLYDGFVYNDTVLSSDSDSDSVILECDAELQQKVVKHLQLFRVKKAVDISLVREEEGSLWVVFDSGHKYVWSVGSDHQAPIEYPLIDSCCAPTPPIYSSKREELPFLKDKEKVPAGGGLLCQQFGDPRLPQLGWRVLVKGSVDESRKLFPKEVKISSTDDQEYKELRYSLGVGEGAAELPLGGCFPLESNGDYLHGISFQKGCYIGQELTARTHHTGIIRKRLMPFRLPDDVSLDGTDLDSLQIVSEKNRPVGKVRGLSRSFGIALVRVDDALNAKTLTLNNHPVSISKPIWWPIQAAKEVSSATKK